jgi:nucleoside-diphosphate-sugar epimerase/phosphohistidine swiveling domain-containing protein
MNGRVLVTGGTGAAGGATVKWLRRLGAEVVVLARRKPERPVDNVSYVSGDIRDPEAVTRAVAGCEAVAHFSWTVSGLSDGEQARALDIGGTTNLLRAMQANNCRRMVFASSITVYGARADHPQPFDEYEPLRPGPSFHYELNKVYAEKMIADSGVDVVCVRPTTIVGRSALTASGQFFRQPVVITPGREVRMQLIHTDDVGRFCAGAALGGPTGPVNLVADDALTFTEIGHLLGRPVINAGAALPTRLANLVGRLPLSKIESVPGVLDLFLHWPLGETRRLREDFGFTCSYSSADAVADMKDWSSSQITLGNRSFRKPARQAQGVAYPRVVIGDDGAAERIMPAQYTGEFDNVTGDPELPEWSAANLSEAFPGPMTPLSLGFALRILCSAGNLVSKLFPLDEALADKLNTKLVASIGHRLHQNLTLMRELSGAIPGQTPETFNNQMFGTPLPQGYQAPKLTPADAWTAARAALLAGPQIAGLSIEVADIERRAQRLVAARPDLTAVTDEHMFRRVEETTDLLVHAWDIGCVNTFLVGLPMTLISERYGDEAARAVRAGTQHLRSAALLHGVRELAGMVNSDGALRRLMENAPRDHVVAELRTAAPEFASHLDKLINRCGHRGPGETELSNPVYADAPELLVRAVLGNVSVADTETVKPALSRSARALVSIAVGAMERRERARDATALITHELRLLIREWGRRLAERGLLDSQDDIHYLSPEEIYAPPADAKSLVTRRRTERERLRGLNFPVHFSQPWEPAAEAESSVGLRTIDGLSVSPGVARGRVRIMTEASDDFESGEVLVANVTDTGWTPFFGCAAAVVTNIGGVMSHAAIVAREFGIPAVTNTLVATQQLRNGQLVEVDGTAGVVRILEDAAVSVAEGT